MMSREKQLSNVSKELGCTLMKLTRRTILLREKKFQDCRNSSRQQKYPALQKRFQRLKMKFRYALVSLTQQIQHGEKRQEKKFSRIIRAFPLKQHQQSNFTWKTRTKRRIKPPKEPAIKSENEALRLSEMLLEYSRYHGQEDLTLVISRATDLLQKMKFKLKAQTIKN